MPTRASRRRGRGAKQLARLAILAVIGVGVSGCSWFPRLRAVREGEKLELQSARLAVPAGPGWKVLRSAEDGARRFGLVHAGDWASISETDVARPLPSRERLLGALSADAREWLQDAAAVIEEVRTDTPQRFGADAVLVVLRAEESDAKAGLLEKHVVHAAQLVFVPPVAPDRTCTIEYVERGATAPSAGSFVESWSRLLDGVELRPVTAASVVAAERSSDFPKVFEPGLARRSFTLPAGGLQASFAWDRWIAPGDSTSTLRLAFGVTDHIELRTPGALRLSFGDADALERPEFAIEGGLLGIDHDGLRGGVWSYGVSVASRKRLARDVAVRGLIAAYGAHESRTARDRAGGEAGADVVWDVHPRLTLGVDARWRKAPSTDANSTRAWIGAGPLVAVHLPLLDLGVNGAAGWHDGQPGFRIGGGLLLTF